MANVANPGVCRVCGDVLPSQFGRGRVRLYCGARCRDKARRHRERFSQHDAPTVNVNLTAGERHRYVGADAGMSGTPVPVAARVAEATGRLLDELDRPESPDGAVAAARDLASAAEAALQEAVDRARDVGRSWREIGGVLGTSRQAAFQRFGHPIDPRTGEAMVRAVPDGAVQRAVAFLGHFTAGRWEEVLGTFDEFMLQRHDASRLARGWSQMIGMFGSYEKMGEVAPFLLGESTVVDALLYFEAGEAMLWVRFDREGRVSGLRLHPPPA